MSTDADGEAEGSHRRRQRRTLVVAALGVMILLLGLIPLGLLLSRFLHPIIVTTVPRHWQITLEEPGPPTEEMIHALASRAVGEVFGDPGLEITHSDQPAPNEWFLMTEVPAHLRNVGYTIIVTVSDGERPELRMKLTHGK